MAVIIKDLGVVTAYAYAVAGGYVGTEAEFEALLGNIAEDLATIENLTVSATTLPPGSQATASYSNGHLTLGIPQGIKGDKGDKGDKGNTGATGNGIASITLTSTSGAVKTYTITFTNGTTTTFDVTDGEVTTESLLETLEEYAKVDGLYEDMTVGNAEQLIASDYVTDKAPYLFRKTGGSTDVGNREYDTLVGASAVWNQLLQDGNFSQTSNWRPLSSSTISIANNECTIGITSNFGGVQSYGYDIPVISGHKYLVLAEIKADSQRSTVGFGLSNSSSQYQIRKIFTVGTSYNTYAFVGQETTGTIDDGRFMLYDTSGSDGVTLNVKNVNAIDLTTFFGSSTIPDYIYSLEQSTAGSGVAWLRQYFPKLFEYHEYDAGTLKSVEGVESHDTVGFNAYNPTTGKAKVLGGNQYQITGAYTALSLEGTTITPDSNGLFTPTVTGELTVTGGNNSTTCIHLVNSGYRNGEYEPYWKRSYPLDSTWVGRGIYKLGSDGKPYADGDRYESDGSGEVRYGIVTLDGSETWELRANKEHQFIVKGATPDSFVIDTPTQTTVKDIVATGYTAETWAEFNAQSSSDKATSFIYGQHWLVFRDLRFSTAEEFKTHLASNPITVVYLLATPTTTTLTPFQSPQICDDFGTEEYVTDCLIPVGHETKYPANLRDKVQHLPDLSNLGNGNYIINQTGTRMSLIPTTSIIPSVPTTNGTYKLKCTVSGGQATLTWEVDS